MEILFAELDLDPDPGPDLESNMVEISQKDFLEQKVLGPSE